MAKKFIKNFWQIDTDKSMETFQIENEYYKNVKNVLENLKKKSFKLAILSNGTPELLNQFVENLFNDIFSIEEVKIYKTLIRYTC